MSLLCGSAMEVDLITNLFAFGLTIMIPVSIFTKFTLDSVPDSLNFRNRFLPMHEFSKRQHFKNTLEHNKWYYIGIQLARQAFPCFPDIYIQKKISWHTSQLPFDITCESTECQKWDMPPFLSVSFLTLLDFCLFNFSETVWQRLTVTCSELMSCNIFSSGGYVQTFNALRHRNCT